MEAIELFPSLHALCFTSLSPKLEINIMKRTELLFVSILLGAVLIFCGCQTTSLPAGTITAPTQSVPAPVPEDFSFLPPAPEAAPDPDLADALDSAPGAGEVLFRSSQVEVRKRLVQEGQVNDALRYVLKTQVNEAIAGLRITETLPANIRLVSADPAPSVRNNEYLWSFGPLESGAVREIAVTVQALREGDHTICSTVSVDNRLCLPFFTGNPVSRSPSKAPPRLN